MKQKMDLNQFYYFVQIVKYEGFSAASRAIDIPKSRLSRHLSELEQQLGVKLIQRNTRHFHLTDIGKRFYEHCQAMLIEAEAAQNVVESAIAEPCGVLKISCPFLLLDTDVSPIISEFMQRYPRVKVELEATNRAIDVMAEGFDIAIRVREKLQEDDLIAKVFIKRRLIVVGQSQWLASYEIHHPNDLNNIPSLALGRPHQQFAWHFTHPTEEQITISHQPRLITTGMHMLLKGAIDGLGLVQLPQVLVKKHLQNGVLTQVLPNWNLRPDIVHAVYGARRAQMPAVKAFLQHMETFYNQSEEDI